MDVSKLMTVQNGAAAAIGAALGPWLQAIYGQTQYEIIYVLMIAIFADWLTGIAAAVKDRVYTSEYGIQGILRTFFILLLPVLGRGIDFVLNTPGIVYYGFVIGTIYHIVQSITANATRAGWDKWIPIKAIQWASSEIAAKQKRAADRWNNLQLDNEEKEDRK